LCGHTKSTLNPQPSIERMRIMTTHTSATVYEEAPHVTETSQTPETTTKTIISDSLRRRAQSVIYDRSIDPQWRAVIRYGLETDDPWLADLVRRADAGETIIDTIDFSQTAERSEVDSIEEEIERETEEKVVTLADIICRAGDEPAAALFVLMGTLEHSTQPKILANSAKHFAFTHCGELNLYGMVDAQIAVVESELLAHSRLMS
jgi:hypothetical protein